MQHVNEETLGLKINPPIFGYKRIPPNKFRPTRVTPGSIGYDLRSPKSYLIPPKEQITIPLLLKVQIPGGHYIRLAPKSGLAETFGIDVLGGVIDPDYTGELGVILINHSDQPFNICRGQHIVQMILEKASILEAEELEETQETSRSTKGFGQATKNHKQ